jgi:diguanylate cyclase (GGDEF)-like protein
VDWRSRILVPNPAWEDHPDLANRSFANFPEPSMIDPPAIRAFADLRSSRLVQIQVIALSLIGIVGGVSRIEGEAGVLAPLLTGALFLLLGLVLFRRGLHQLSTYLTLATMTALVSVLLWRYQGLLDPALLAYPGILVFAAILGSTRLFTLLLVFMIGFMGLLSLASHQGWHVAVVSPVGTGTFVDQAAILLAIGCGVWIMSRQLRQTVVKLEAEFHRDAQSQTMINFLSNHDRLTGLPNLILGRQHFQNASTRNRSSSSCVALFQLDLDNFKTVPDALGQTAGDQLLRMAGARLLGTLRSSDILCRRGGDEFLAILVDLESTDEAAVISARINAIMARPYQIQGLDVVVTASIGIALFPGDGRDFEILLQKADTAMFKAKAEGRNTFRFFDKTMNANMLEHLRLASFLHKALERSEMFLHYQPQVELASGRIVGVEALLRWHHPDLGLIPPGTFIPIAEWSGQIGEIGTWALQEACRQARLWRDQGMDLVLSVNLSPIQFNRDDIETTIQEALEKADLPPSCIELELTESMLIGDSPDLIEKLARLRASGLRFAIDDFGTGYSNLSYLQRFEVERLKIDQSFVGRLCQNPRDEAIVRTIILMAKNLGMSSVAEGIEDEATLACLKSLGCDIGQGYLWSRPCSPEDFVAMWASRQEPVGAGAPDRGGKPLSGNNLSTSLRSRHKRP